MSDRAPLVQIEDAKAASVFVSVLNSIVLDFTARSAIGGTDLSFFIIKQLPALPPETFLKSRHFNATYMAFIVPRVLELTYTAYDLHDFARDLGWDGPPFRWNAERRFLLRCELDAAFFHLYLPAEDDGDWRPAHRSDGSSRDETPEQLAELKRHFPTPRDAVAYIMDTFPIVRRKDEENHGEYRTKRIILEIYDAMQASIATGEPYQTWLNPPPAAMSCCHQPRENA